MYLSIGFSGEILPKTSTFQVTSDIQVENVTEIVMKSILATLDAYFSTQMSPLTSQRILVVQDKMMKCSRHFIVLYQLLDKIAGRVEPRLPITRKLHASCCNITPFMEDFGTLDKACTTSWESCHRYSTVGLWNCTSRRYDTQNTEMGNHCMLLNYNVTNDFIAAVTTNTIEDYVKKNGPYIAPDEVEMLAVTNMKSFTLSINFADVMTGNESYVALLKESNLSEASASILLKNTVGEKAWRSFKREVGPTVVTCIQAISIEGNEDSRLGKIILYATHKFRNKRPRYDKVIVQLEGDTVQPAQLLALYMITSHNHLHTQYFAMVRYLMQVDDKEDIPTRYECPFAVYKWELGPYIGQTRQTVVQFIHVNTIMGPAFMPPVISKTRPSPISRHPRPTDRFWFVDRKYCDRAGWDNIQNSELIVNTGTNEDDSLYIAVPNLSEIDIDDPDIYVDDSDDDEDEVSSSSSSSGDDEEECV
jgi:hypothetical protein